MAAKIKQVASLGYAALHMHTVQGVKVGTLGRQIERNSSYVWLAHTSIFGLCFMSVCLIKSNGYSFKYSSLHKHVTTN